MGQKLKCGGFNHSDIGCDITDIKAHFTNRLEFPYPKFHKMKTIPKIFRRE